jgi:hypothetical protein
LWQLQRFLQRHDIDAAGFEYGPVGQWHAVQRQLAYPFGHRGALARQERGAHPVSPVAKSEIEAGRLDLVVIGGPRQPDHPARAVLRDDAGGEDALGRDVWTAHAFTWRM